MKIIFFLLVVSISCKREVNGISSEEKIGNKEENIIKYSIFYPDTVQKNQINKGYIMFKSDLDTIGSELGYRRFTFYYAQIAEDVKISYANVKNQELDTFGALNNKKTPFGSNLIYLGIFCR